MYVNAAVTARLEISVVVGVGLDCNTYTRIVHSGHLPRSVSRCPSRAAGVAILPPS